MAVGRLLEAKITCDLERIAPDMKDVRHYIGRFWWMGAAKEDYWCAKALVHKDTKRWVLAELQLGDCPVGEAGGYWWWSADAGLQIDEEFISDHGSSFEQAWARAGMLTAYRVLVAFVEEMIINLELNVPGEEEGEDGESED